MLLSDHFSLEELTDTSVRLPNSPTEKEIDELRRLCLLVLEPARDLKTLDGRPIGSLIVSSGFRSQQVNKAVRGSKTSAHMFGRAADIQPLRPITCLDLMEALDASDLSFDQLIYERPVNSTWIHVGITMVGNKPRRQSLMCLKPGVFEKWDRRNPRVK